MSWHIPQSPTFGKNCGWQTHIRSRQKAFSVEHIPPAAHTAKRLPAGLWRTGTKSETDLHVPQLELLSLNNIRKY